MINFKDNSSKDKYEIERLNELYKSVLTALDNNVLGVSFLLGKLYKINGGTLKSYLTRGLFAKPGSRKFYLNVFEKFCKKYDDPEKIKQIYYRTIYGVDKECFTLQDALKIVNHKFTSQNATLRIKKMFPSEVLISAKNPVRNKNFVCKDAIDKIDATINAKPLDVWKKVLKLRDELVGLFKDKAKFCYYLSDISNLTQNAIYVTLFYRIDRNLYNNKKLEVALKYLAILKEAEVNLKGATKK